MAISINAQELRLKDNDSYLACLMAKEEHREKLFALFLFHHEIYNIPQISSEPMVGKIKLQWWRDVLQEIEDGKPARPHPILQELKEDTKIFGDLKIVLDSYEKILDGYQPKTLQEIETFLDETIVVIFRIAANILNKTHNDMIGRALGYQYLACQIYKNHSKAEKFATAPEALISQLIEKSINNYPEKSSAFLLITKHNIKNISNDKPKEKSRWKLILNLMFKKLEVL